MRNFSLALALLSLMACSKKKTAPHPTSCPNYEKGMVLCQLTNQATVEDAFALFNGQQLPISILTEVNYTSPFPADSVPSLTAQLSAKQYINHGVGYTAYVYVDSLNGGTVTMNLQFYDMDPGNQQDWIATAKKLALTERETIDSVSRPLYSLVKVPEGEEAHWAGVLGNEPLISSSNLDCLYLTDPLPTQ